MIRYIPPCSTIAPGVDTIDSSSIVHNPERATVDKTIDHTTSCKLPTLARMCGRFPVDGRAK